MLSPWKVLSEDNEGEKMLFKKNDMMPVVIAEHFNFSLHAALSHLHILKDSDLLTKERKQKTGFSHWIERP
jgi:hypothetical protein